MSNCTNDCNSCNAICVSSCPICKVKGKLVPLETAISLVLNPEGLKETNVYICINRKCNVVYFQEDNLNIYFKENVKEKIFFKSTLNDYIVCYCHNIKLTDIVEYVKNSKDEELSKEKIFKALNLTDKKDCIHKNPLGETCDKIFENAIEFAYKQKQENGGKI